MQWRWDSGGSDPRRRLAGGRNLRLRNKKQEILSQGCVIFMSRKSQASLSRIDNQDSGSVLLPAGWGGGANTKA